MQYRCTYASMLHSASELVKHREVRIPRRFRAAKPGGDLALFPVEPGYAPGAGRGLGSSRMLQRLRAVKL